MTPAEVVAEYYTWHLGAGNVLVSKAYRSNDHLSAAFVRKVDEIIASFSRGGYDPFLCAQDIPRDMRLDPVQIRGNEARVGVHGIWNPGTQYELANDILVVLQRQRGQWKIVDIRCPGTQAAMPGSFRRTYRTASLPTRSTSRPPSSASLHFAAQGKKQVRAYIICRSPMGLLSQHAHSKSGLFVRAGNLSSDRCVMA